MKRAFELMIMLMLAAVLLVGGLASAVDVDAAESAVSVACVESNP